MRAPLSASWTAWPETRIEKAINERRDEIAIAISAAPRLKRCQYCATKAQVLDPLTCPLCADLRTRNTPDLLGVGLEEHFKQAPPRSLHHPVFKGLVGSRCKQARMRVAPYNSHRLNDTQATKSIDAPQRVMEEAIIIEDPGEPVALQQLVAHQLLPNLLNFLHLAEEAVPTDIKPVAAIIHGPADPPDGMRTLQNVRTVTKARQFIRSSQTGWTGSNNQRIRQSSLRFRRGE